MSIVSYIALAEILNTAGFPAGTSQAEGLAICQAESGRDPNAKHVNTDGSIDRGIWQINDKAHPDVSDATAFDPVLSTRAALSISKGGTDYGPWSTFTNGAYKAHLEAAKVALDGAAKMRALQSQLADAKKELAKAQASLASEVDVANGLQDKIAAAKAVLG
jgi:hypothetical protein